MLEKGLQSSYISWKLTVAMHHVFQNIHNEQFLMQKSKWFTC